jgi:hypothetical protein
MQAHRFNTATFGRLAEAIMEIQFEGGFYAGGSA